MKKQATIVFLVILSSIWMMSCDFVDSLRSKTQKTNASKIVSVGKHTLYQEDLMTNIPKFSNVSDSTNFVNAYIEDWTIAQLEFDKATHRKSRNNSIEEKVEDYRKELYVHDLEQEIIALYTSEVVTEKEVTDFYSEYKNQDLLTTDIFKASIVILYDEVERISRFDSGWRRANQTIIEEYKAIAHFHQMDTSVWYSRYDLLELLPVGFPSEKLNGKGFKKSKVGEEYCFVRIFDTVLKGNPAPLEYVRPQIKKILGYQKQRDFLKRYKEDLYNEALRLKKIQLY